MPHDIMAGITILSQSQFHTIAKVPVHISTVKDDKEIYNPDSSKKNQFSFTKRALAKFANAAAMSIAVEGSRSWIEPDRVFHSVQYVEYMQVDGTTVKRPGEKTIDLRKGGTRWAKKVGTETDKALKAWGSANGCELKQSHGWTEDYTNWIFRIRETMPKDELEKLERLAQFKADKFVIQTAQFGQELAETGALNRAIRSILELKSTYTKQEIEEGFIVYRSRYDWKAVQDTLGAEFTEKLQQGYVMKQLGMTAKDMEAVLPASTEPEMPEELETLGFPDDEVLEGEVVEETDESALFGQPVAEDTLGNVQRLAGKAYNKAISSSAYDELTQGFFNVAAAGMSEGQALLLKGFLGQVLKWRQSKALADNIKANARDLRPAIAQCNKERRLLRDTDIVQPTLPLEGNNVESTS